VNSFSIVISPVTLEFPLEIESIPKGHLIEEFAADCPDQPLNERMRERDIGNRLDLCDIEDPEIRLPLPILKQWLLRISDSQRNRLRLQRLSLKCPRNVSQDGPDAPGLGRQCFARAQIGCSFAETIQDQELMLEEQGFSNNGAYPTTTDWLRDCHDQMNQKEGQVAHPQDRSDLWQSGETAKKLRIYEMNWEFVTHRLQEPKQISFWWAYWWDSDRNHIAH